MKKLLILFGLTVITTGLQADTRDDLVREQAQIINRLNAATFWEEQYPIKVQQAILAEWDQAVMKAKKFVIDNSKDLIGRQDSVLMQAMSQVENLNNDFSNTIKIVRGSRSTAMIKKLQQISMEADKIMKQLQAKSFTLSSKKAALSLLVGIADRIKSSAEYLHKKAQE